ncbi:MAG: MerC domain-containing protein [Pseudomonadales bacterium]
MRVDVIGLVLSGSCLVHCLLLPVALVAAPSVAIWLGETETSVHWALFAIALVVSGWALYTGFRRHRVALVVVVGAIGLTVMGIAASHLFGRASEAALTLVGASVVALAHVVNLRLSVGAGHAER